MTEGKGLQFFNSSTSLERKRRRLIFVAVYLVSGLMVMWPVYPFFAQPKPFILGLPLSLVWVVAALALSFCALLWLFRSEPIQDEEVGDRGGRR